MKVLHICSSDSVGGAARSAYSLHQNLLQQGLDSQFFALEKSLKDNNVITNSHGYIKRRVLASIDDLPTSRYKKRSKDFTFTNNWFWFTEVRKQINKVKPDLIHIHWIGKGVLRLEQLGNLRAPIVWTMHDNYAFTGGCHLINGCTHYREQCGCCPQLGSNQSNDLSAKNFNRKKRIFPKLDITFIAPSNWMEELAIHSKLLSDLKIVKIPNVRNRAFFPMEKKSAKAALNLDPEKKMIVFGALNAVADINKGFIELLGSLKLLSKKEQNVQICVFGASSTNLKIEGLNINFLGYLHDDISKRVLYSAADLTIVPSKIENLSNVIMESMACGTSVLAFNTGGNFDLIDHEINGFLAADFSSQALLDGILWILNNNYENKLGILAHEKISKYFSPDEITIRHINLYSSILND